MSVELPASVVGHIERGESRLLADLLLGMTEAERGALVPALVDRVRAHVEGWEHQAEVGPLMVAGAACMPTAARAAAWLARRTFRWVSSAMRDVVQGEVVRVMLARAVPWYPDLATRVAAHLPPRPRDIDPWAWSFAAALVETSGAPVPIGDGFVLGWIGDVTWHTTGSPLLRLRADPFLDVLLPHLFQVDGAGARLEVSASQRRQAGYDPSAAGPGALATLAAEGRVPRDLLLDGCLGRLLRGDRPGALRGFVRLYEALAPNVPEIAARTGDYLRLLPDAQPTVASLAQHALRTLDRAGRLPVDTVIEASHLVLGRSEKALVRNQLLWLDTVLNRVSDRTDDLLAAVTVACGHPALELRDRATALIDRYTPRASTRAVAKLVVHEREIPPDLPRPRPLPPRPMPPPIRSGAELAAHLTRLLDPGIVTDPIGFELVLDAMVRMAATRGDELRISLRPLTDRYRPGISPSVGEYSIYQRLTTIVAQVAAPSGGPLRRWLRRAPPGHADRASIWHQRLAAPSRLLLARLDEIARNIPTRHRPGLLLATPTTPTGLVDAGTLTDRIATLEDAGGKPWHFDLEQALLRLPRTGDPHAVARAGKLRSPAGQRLAAHLTAGVRDPLTVLTTSVRRRSNYWYSYDQEAPPWPRPAVRCTPANADSPMQHALLSHDPDREVGDYHLLLWPAVLPAHRDVVAAHALHTLLLSAERDIRGAAQLLPALAECDGPAGPALALALAYGLATKDQHDRVAATDALLHLIATRALDPAAIGQAIATVLDDSQVKLTRIVAALKDAANAGATNAVWHIALAALPTQLAAGKPPPGTPDLLELATRLTPAPPPHTPPVDCLAQLAARTGSSRLVTEARRLHKALTG